MTKPQLYNDALRSSGYDETIQYEENRQTQAGKKNRARSRNVIWFNPPFSQNVQTNVAKSFLHLIDKHFPKSHNLHKIFNRNKLKESYSCTTNITNIIKNHNKKILNECEMTNDRKRCNCRNKDLCPLGGKCLTNKVIYEATVTAASGTASNYIGMTGNDFKTRFNNHKLSFRNQNHSHNTVLSKYIWELKDNDTIYDIKWHIIKRANTYKGNLSRCNLCLSEKL